LRALLACPVLLLLAIDVLGNGRVEKLIHITSFLFSRRPHIVNWLNIDIQEKAFCVNVNRVPKCGSFLFGWFDANLESETIRNSEHTWLRLNGI